MPTVYVRNFPEELHREVRSKARRERRSMGAEIIVLVEEALSAGSLREQRLQALKGIAERRTKREFSPQSETLDMLREDRNR